ncbi:MAG: hypothetical protein Q9199_000565 [Rusavskia elegans]
MPTDSARQLTILLDETSTTCPPSTSTSTDPPTPSPSAFPAPAAVSTPSSTISVLGITAQASHAKESAPISMGSGSTPIPYPSNIHGISSSPRLSSSSTTFRPAATSPATGKYPDPTTRVAQDGFWPEGVCGLIFLPLPR